MDPDSSPPARRRRDGEARLQVSVIDGRGRPVADGGLARWLVRVAPASARGELAVALVTDARMRVLNRTYRGKDYPTDVLSFAGPKVRGSVGPRVLGDIVIATGVAARQARGAGHSYGTELRVLAVHGLLHLLGYDHGNPRERRRMARREARLLRGGGLASGLIAR